MKYKRALFIFFFLVLFLLQQTQVDAQRPSTRDSLSSNFQTSEWPVKVLVFMKEFTPDGEPTDNPCFQGSIIFGCVEPNSGLVYPPSSQYITFPQGGSNPMLVDMEHYSARRGSLTPLSLDRRSSTSLLPCRLCQDPRFLAFGGKRGSGFKSH